MRDSRPTCEPAYTFGVRWIRHWTIVAGWLLALPSVAEAADRHLRPATDCPIGGDGSAHGCAASAGGTGAFNTFAAAEAATQAGDVVRLDGDFELNDPVFWDKGGTAEAPVRLTSYDERSPARLVGSFTAGLLYLRGDHLELDHLRFNNAGGGCLAVSKDATPAERWVGRRIHHNHLERCQIGMGIADLEDGEIYDNVLEEISFDSESTGLHHCIYPAQGARNIRIYRNVCRKAINETRSHCLHVFHDEDPGPPEDIYFFNNVCIGFDTGAGVYNGSQNIRIFHNTFVTDQGLRGLTCRYGGSQAQFMNNIVVGEMTSMTYVDSPACDLEIDYNLYFDPSGSVAFQPLDAEPVAADEWQALGFDAHSVIDAGPLLGDPDAGDMSLMAGSPAIDAGATLADVAVDFLGVSRPQGAASDIGAFEFVDSSQQTVFSAIDFYGDRSNYTESASSRWAVVDDAGDLRYELTQTFDADVGLGGIALATGKTFADFTMRLRARTPERLSWADICVVFGYQDPEHYYYVMLNSEASANGVQIVDGGEERELFNAGQALVADNEYHDIDVSRVGAEIVVSVDGVEVMRTADTTYAAGGIGVGALNNRVYFDDVEVSTGEGAADSTGGGGGGSEGGVEGTTAGRVGSGDSTGAGGSSGTNLDGGGVGSSDGCACSSAGGRAPMGAVIVLPALGRRRRRSSATSTATAFPRSLRSPPPTSAESPTLVTP